MKALRGMLALGFVIACAQGAAAQSRSRSPVEPDVHNGPVVFVGAEYGSPPSSYLIKNTQDTKRITDSLHAR